MKIKRKVEMNLPQLIEWAKENDIKNKIFIGKQNYYNVGFDIPGFIYFNSSNTMPLDETFTVTTEEEITEDTVIPKMVEIYLDRERDFDFADVHLNQSINKVKDDYEFGCKSLTFHKMNDDGTHTLIWRDGKLIKE